MPIILFPLVFFTIGFTWILASLGVYLRDVAQIVGLMITTLMFLSPIFYPLSSLPKQYQALLSFNPLAVIIEETRKSLIWGHVPDLITLAILTIISMIMACLGFAWFQKTRKGFADVL